ncbi:MAG: pitrilysin family protein [bacterium]|nr:pitrilysin family protein [bacterium]
MFAKHLKSTILYLIFIMSPVVLIAQNDISEFTLDNGMTVLIKENHTAKITALRAYVKAGSLYEGKHLGSGLSHYFEHIMAGGTTRNHTEEYFNKLKQEIGADYNAYTSFECTCYKITVNSKYFNEALGMLADWLTNCAFDSTAIAREKGVILKEILMREVPERKANQIFNNTLYKIHPVQYPIIGYAELFKKLTRDDILAYYKKFYVPNNMLFVVVGDFDKDTVLLKIKEAFKNFEKKSIDFPILPVEPQQINKRVVETELDASATNLTIGYHTVDTFDEDMYPLDILADVLGGDKNSRFNKILKEEKQLVNYIYGYSSTPSYVKGAFIIGTETSDPQNVEEIKKIISAEIKNVRQNEISDYELKKSKKRIMARKLLYSQDIETQASNIGENWIATNDPSFYDDTYIPKIQKVTKEDIKRVANKYFYDENMVIVTVKPIGSEKPATKDTLSEKQIKEEIQKIKLDNGITLLLKRNSNFPTASIEVAFKTGTRYETEENNGITNFVAKMLLRGTKKRTAEEISEEFEKRGSSISFATSKDISCLTTDILKNDIDQVMDVLADILCNSTFPEKEIEKLRKDIIADINRQKENPETLAEQFFSQQLYTKHPYRLTLLGTEKNVSKLTRNDIKSYYEKFVVPNNMVIGIFGDFDKKEIVRTVEKAFKEFKSKEIFTPEIPPEPELSECKEVFNYYSHPQVMILWGFPTVKGADEDFYVLNVITNIFGGNCSRLYKALRGEKDLVYYAYGYQPISIDPSTFIITVQTSQEKYKEVVSILKKEVERLKNEPLTDKEMEDFKKEMINLYPIYNQTNAQQISKAVSWETLGFGYQFFDKFLDNIQKVTAKDVQRVANKYFAKSVLTVSMPKEK